eukprot:scaffold16407_cov127-Isochrysis_galbana.AAC.9
MSLACSVACIAAKFWRVHLNLRRARRRDASCKSMFRETDVDQPSSWRPRCPPRHTEAGSSLRPMLWSLTGLHGRLHSNLRARRPEGQRLSVFSVGSKNSLGGDACMGIPIWLARDGGLLPPQGAAWRILCRNLAE